MAADDAVRGRGLRILLALDLDIVAEALAASLRAQDLEVIGRVEDASRIAAETSRAAPDVILFDPQLPGLEGPLLETLSRRDDVPPLLALELSRDHSRSWELLRRGASGYLDAGASARELFQALEAVARGECFLSSRATRRVIERMSRPEVPAEITGREREILHLVAEGLSSREIGARLRVSARTVESHRVHLMEKIGAENTAHLVRLAIREGLIGS